MSEIRVMSYNVRYFGHRSRGLTSSDQTLKEIAEAIASLQPLPSVISLQEVETHSLRADLGRAKKREKPQFNRLLDALEEALFERGISRRYTGQYFPSHNYKLPGDRSLYTTGLGIVYSDDLQLAGEPSARDITHRRIKATARLKQTRICAHVPLMTERGARLDLFNTHLSLPQFMTWRAIAFTRQMGYGQNQLFEIFNALDFIQEVRQSDHIILNGDFNALPDSLVYEHVLDEGALVDPLRQEKSLSTSDSYRSFPSAGFMNLRMHLDYMFSSPSLRWTDFEGTQAYGHPSPFHGLSDHAPIIGRVTLN